MITDKKYTVKNWQQFQHFKDRNPPWIKLYRTLLDDPDFFALKAEHVRPLVLIWLLASESKTGNGELPTIDKVAFRLRMSETEAAKHLTALSQWVTTDDINMISTRYQNDTPETETETERETETEAEGGGFQSDIKPISKKTFKQWTVGDLTDSVKAANTDNLLTALEAADFVGYWTEKTASGRFRFHLQPTWDTRRRMQTAVRVVYEKQRTANQPRNAFGRPVDPSEFAPDLGKEERERDEYNRKRLETMERMRPGTLAVKPC